MPERRAPELKRANFRINALSQVRLLRSGPSPHVSKYLPTQLPTRCCSALCEALRRLSPVFLRFSDGRSGAINAYWERLPRRVAQLCLSAQVTLCGRRSLAALEDLQIVGASDAGKNWVAPGLVLLSLARLSPPPCPCLTAILAPEGRARG